MLNQQQSVGVKGKQGMDIEGERMSTTAVRLQDGITLRSRLAAVIVATFALMLAQGVMSASAAMVHPFVTSINGSETSLGLIFPTGMAVDNSSSASAGDLYVSDLFATMVDQFDETGKFLKGISGPPEGPFVGLSVQDAVDASGNLYVGDSGGNVVDEFSPTGEFIEPQIKLTESVPNAIAVNGSEEALIATDHKVFRYDPGTSKLSTFATGTPEEFGKASGVAVDDDSSSPSFGDVYVVDEAKGAVDVFDSSGKYLSQLAGTPAFVYRDVVDPTTGDLYVTGEAAVYEFSPTGELMSTTPVEGGMPLTVATGAKDGDLYVGVPFAINVYGPAVTIPDVSSSGPSNVEPTSVTLDGHVDPAGGGEVTACQVEYGISTSYEETAPCSPAAPYASPTAVSAGLAGLTPDTVYYFRFAAHNANNIDNHSEGATFETTGPPTIGEQSADGITRTSATLHGHVNPHGNETTYHFEYGPTESYGSSTPDVSAGAGTEEVPVSAEISGLEIGATYHYRLVAEGDSTVVPAPDSTFTVEPVATVTDLSELAGPHDATLTAKVEDFGTTSTCEVEYVTEAQFASTGYAAPTLAQCTPEDLVGSTGELRVIARPKGLMAGTNYHFRFLISNEYGEQQSQDQAFATFGLAAFSMESQEQEGHPYTQAGGHPYVLATHIDLSANTAHNGLVGPSGSVRDIHVHLPAGFIGNPQATPQCTRYDSERQACSGASQIGMITIQIGGSASEQVGAKPLFNLVPPHGVAAEFSARFSKLASAFIDGAVRTGSDYGLDANSLNITTQEPVVGVTVQIWGVPADSSHDVERFCPGPGSNNGYESPPCQISAPLRPFLTNPTSCTGDPLVASVDADSYQAPGEFAELGTEMPTITGCDRLHFTPAIEVRPEASASDSPTGLHVDLHIPQEENASGLAEADLRDARVTLPEGLTVNPASAGGLTGCSEAQIDLHGPEPASCPDSSKVGTVELISPLVDHPLHGAVYVAEQGNGGPAQGSNPFGSLIALYVVIDDPQTGVVVKLAGKVVLDPGTGRLTTTFSENPQLPFEDLRLDFFGGARAALATPSVCGSYAASASFTSWAEPASGVSYVAQPFAITSGPGGAPCPSGGFKPAFTAGTQSGQAGAFTPFVLSFSRQDGEPRMTGLEATLAPGLLGKLAGVPLCGSAEAAAGACPAASQIGTVTTAAGAGPDPISVQGQVYLTGPYNGGPFGEVVEVPAIAGPFNLGTVVVRGSIRVNPLTAQASVVSDPFPTMLQGVPLHLRRVTVTLDRSGFTFNPTNCDQLAIAATITGEGGANASVSAPFQVANCAKLPFKPRFSVSTQAKSSKAGGASLRVKITSGAGQANLGKIKVDLPKQLPSRFSTLQKACLAAVFAANPASCPAGSMVGSAKAVTPLLATPFTGPAYLVSHGGAAFPDLELVLQSEGITLIEDGKTDIKHGITSSTFGSIPDAPITTIELTLPQGPHSALSAFLPPKAKYNMCGQKLVMPTHITGQNGAVIEQTTKIAVTGCPKKHKAKKSSRTKSRRHG